jgi:glutamate N-acetyltransferase/amino-acid N-acetyltransferase
VLILEIIPGGVTAPKGFMASGRACGIKKDGSYDIALVCADDTAIASGVFTTNAVKGHSLQMTMEHIKDGRAKAVIINSGNANACVGEKGKADAAEVANQAAKLLNCRSEDILFNSTGVIGVPLDMDAVRAGIKDVIASKSYEGGHDAARAIMTTDLSVKEFALEFEVGSAKARIGGMAKGSGMIHPNMATMIGVITTDVNITQNLMEKAFKEAVNTSFNRISVDGDTSVCDMVVIMSSQKAGNNVINKEDSEYIAFKDALGIVCGHLAKEIVKDGEGATKLIEITAEGAKTQEDAYKIVCAVAKSPLVKTAIFGEDANWGRIITAAGYSGAFFDYESADIFIGDLMVCNKGAAVAFDECRAKEILKKDEIKILIRLNTGNCRDRMWACDFSYDYIKINGSYRS